MVISRENERRLTCETVVSWQLNERSSTMLSFLDVLMLERPKGPSSIAMMEMCEG